MSRNGSQSRLKLDGPHWDRVAPNWNKEVFNTLACDRSGTIAAALRKAAAGSTSVADYGCGVGIYLPLLAKLFREVHGFEQSQACARVARRRVRANGRVTVHVAQAAPRAFRGRFDVALCVNVAINPRKRVWGAVMRSARSLLAPGGSLVLVVPSIESADLIARAEGADDDAPAPRRTRGRARGIVWNEGIPEKHYRRKELADALREVGLSVREIRRVEYSWRSHDIVPPANLRGLRPWDWIAVARNARPA